MLRGQIGPVMQALLVAKEVFTYLVGPGEVLEIKKKKVVELPYFQDGQEKKNKYMVFKYVSVAF